MLRNLKELTYNMIPWLQLQFSRPFRMQYFCHLYNNKLENTRKALIGKSYGVLLDSAAERSYDVQFVILAVCRFNVI